jgi:RNA binding exosome subunit
MKMLGLSRLKPWEKDTVSLLPLRFIRTAKDQYKGHVGDVASIVRVALTTSQQSPNLYQVLHILSQDEIRERVELTITKLD